MGFVASQNIDRFQAERVRHDEQNLSVLGPDILCRLVWVDCNQSVWAVLSIVFDQRNIPVKWSLSGDAGSCWPFDGHYCGNLPRMSLVLWGKSSSISH